MTVSWQSHGGGSAWLASLGSVYSYLPASNVRNLSGAVGPLPGTGSRSVNFDCTAHYLYVALGLYNAAGASGEILQIRNPA